MTALRRTSLLAALGLAAALLVTPPIPATADPGECINEVPSLQKAPMIPGDLSPTGHPVAETTLNDGTSIPVVMVHGWTGQSIHDNSRAGNFSQVVNLTKTKGQSVDIGRSLIGVIQDAGGTTVYTFDYHDTSSRWVTDDTIGRRLANALSCLASAHGHPTVVVAHSMGGLATRQALDLIAKDQTHGPVEENVSDVITYGTPNSGSWLASVIGAGDQVAKYALAFPGAGGAAVTAIRSLVTICGAATTKSMTDAGLCGGIAPQLASATSQAARALAIGSPEMKALPKWPQTVRVQSMYGSADVEVVKIGWFGSTVEAGSVNVGDFVVGAESGRGGARLSQGADCSYTLDWTTATADNLLEAMQLRAAGETKDNAVFAAADSPCFHGNLMRDIEFSNTVLATIAELVDAQNRMLSEPGDPPELAGRWCTLDGSECFSFADTREKWPNAQVKGEGYESPTGSTQYSLCLAFDLDGEDCTMAATMFLEYFPPGVGWNCEDVAAEEGFPGCETDYTDQHDPSKPRLKVLPNHQQGDLFWDTPPMYQQ
ncbi:esterase/lipase family protein [Mycolicibacterium sp.]|uniref:esterase/lipase family protein n=1 Tax=Mycolicibacterium sp. TaxID=2320850 RepID=UPI0037CC2FF4